MYRLYVIVGNNSYVGRCFDEEDLVKTMVHIVNKYHVFEFDIWEVLDNTPYHYREIHGQKEFENMLNTYKITKDIPDMSCLELKDEITRRYLHPKQYRHQ